MQYKCTAQGYPPWLIDLPPHVAWYVWFYKYWLSMFRWLVTVSCVISFQIAFCSKIFKWQLFGRHEWFGLRRLITKNESAVHSGDVLHKMSQVQKNGQFEGYSTEQCISGGLHGAPIQDGWSTGPITTEIIISRCSVLCYFFAAFLRLKFRSRNKAEYSVDST